MRTAPPPASRPGCAALALVAGVAAALAPGLASAVRLDLEGRGEALLYPYYSAQSNAAGTFNTYLSVVNATTSGKALRVRFHEPLHGQEVASLNVYLSPNDMWTAALIPHGNGTRLISGDASCTDPALAPDPAGGPLAGIDFSNARYASDAAGAGLDRTREGYFEILDMGTLSGTALAAATHNSAGVPANCAYLRGAGNVTVTTPTGGLSGTLTLIDVQRGFDFTLKPEALAELATAPYFRPPSDPYPALDAAEIAPVSVVATGAAIYRSRWGTGLEAVEAVLMRHTTRVEYTLDEPTRSKTDVVVNFPTRRFRTGSATAVAPFKAPARWTDCTVPGEPFFHMVFNREERGTLWTPTDFPTPPPGTRYLETCANTNVMPVYRDAGATSLLSSAYQGSYYDGLPVISIFRHGFIDIFPRSDVPEIASLPTSERMDLATGAITTGPHTFRGLPLQAFSARSFENGTLSCGAGACQGNYGGAFPATYRVWVSP